MASPFGSDSVSGFEKDPKLEDQDQKKESENEEKNKGKRKLSDYELQELYNKRSDKYWEEWNSDQNKECREESRVEASLSEQDERMAEAEEEKELERQERERIRRVNERTIKQYKAVVPAMEWEDTVKTIRERAEKDKEEWAGKEGRIQELRKARDSGLPFTGKQLLEIFHWEKRQNEFLKSEDKKEMDIMMVACSALGPIYEGDATNIKIDDEEKELERKKWERTVSKSEKTIKRFKAVTPAKEWEDAVKTMRERAQKEKEEWAGKEWRIQALKKAFYSAHPLTAEHLADIRDWQKKQKEFLRSEEEQEMDIMLNACSAIGARYIGYNNDISNIYISSDDD